MKIHEEIIEKSPSASVIYLGEQVLWNRKLGTERLLLQKMAR